jgi:hypothetical protein
MQDLVVLSVRREIVESTVSDTGICLSQLSLVVSSRVQTYPKVIEMIAFGPMLSIGIYDILKFCNEVVDYDVPPCSSLVRRKT